MGSVEIHCRIKGERKESVIGKRSRNVGENWRLAVGRIMRIAILVIRRCRRKWLFY